VVEIFHDIIGLDADDVHSFPMVKALVAASPAL